MEEAVGREREESRVEDRRSWRSNEMEGRYHGGDEVYPATFGNEKKTGLKLDRKKAEITSVNTGKETGKIRLHQMFERQGSFWRKLISASTKCLIAFFPW